MISKSRIVYILLLSLMALLFLSFVVSYVYRVPSPSLIMPSDASRIKADFKIPVDTSGSGSYSYYDYYETTLSATDVETFYTSKGDCHHVKNASQSIFGYELPFVECTVRVEPSGLAVLGIVEKNKAGAMRKYVTKNTLIIFRVWLN